MYRNTKHLQYGLRSGSPGRGRKGFTLVEVVVTATVSAVLTVGVLGYFLTMYKIGFVNQERNLINANMRSLTSTLMQDGRQSSYFVLYRSTDEKDHDKANDRRLDGNSGDLLVFVYTGEGSGGGLNASSIERFVAYYRLSVDGGVEGGFSPVRRLERNFESGSSEPIEALLPEESELAQADEVIELSRGLADGRLFYNFWGRSVMINGQIYHGNKAKRVTETYNFTISPRG